jgi:aconitate hydratase
VVGKFVEFFGPGVSSIPVETRVTLANISPEYVAGLFIIAVRPKPVPVGPRAGRWR